MRIFSAAVQKFVRFCAGAEMLTKSAKSKDGREGERFARPRSPQGGGASEAKNSRPVELCGARRISAAGPCSASRPLSSTQM